MRRKVYEQLLKWKEEQHGESAVLINGVRRVGKSYIVNRADASKCVRLQKF